MADFVEELFANARDCCLLVTKPLDFPPIKNPEFPIFDHGGVNLVAAIRAAKYIAKFKGQLFKMLRRPAEKAELSKRGLPLRFPFPLDGLNLEIKHLGRPNDAQRNFLAFIQSFEFNPRVVRHAVYDFAASSPIVPCRQWLSEQTDGFKVRPATLAPVVIASAVFGEPNLNPLILVELLVRRPVPIVNRIEPDPFVLLGYAGGANKFLMGLRRMRVRHHCDEYFRFGKCLLHITLSSLTGSKVRRETSAPSRLRWQQ